MSGFMKGITNTVKGLGNGVKATVKAVAKAPTQIAKAPVKIAKAVSNPVDSVSLQGRSATKPEVNHRQMAQASKGQPQQTKAPAKPPTVKKTHKKNFALSREVLSQQSPAQQRTYLKRVKEEGGSTVEAALAKNQKKPAKTRYFDEIAGYGFSETFKGIKNVSTKAYDYALDREGIKRAEATALELEQKKTARFESKLATQSPERFARYKAHNEAADANIAADADQETWNRRQRVIAEETRTKNLLAQDPNKSLSRLTPQQRQRHLANTQRAERTITQYDNLSAWHKTQSMANLDRSEKSALPQKAAWLKSLSPEQRAAFEAREQADNKKIEENADVAWKKKLEAINAASMGTNQTLVEQGALAAAADLLSGGGVSAAREGGRGLGRGQAYRDQAANLRKAGLVAEADGFQTQGRQMTASGAVNTVMAAASGFGVQKFLRNKYVNHFQSKLKPLPSRTATVTAAEGVAVKAPVAGKGTVQARSIAGTTGNAADNSLAVTFDDVVESSSKAGNPHRLEVKAFNYKRVDTWRDMKPKWEAIPTTHYSYVHGAEKEFAKRIGKTLEDLPEATYQAIREVDDFHVGDFTHFRNSDGSVTTGLQGAVETSQGKMVLNRNTIDHSLREVTAEIAHENSRRMSRGMLANAASEEGFKLKKADALLEANKNLRETIYHETAHIHDELLEMTSSGRYATPKGDKWYSSYARETGMASEDLAEGYSQLLELRYQTKQAQGNYNGFYEAAISHPTLGRRNKFILDEMIENIDPFLNEVR